MQMDRLNYVLWIQDIVSALRDSLPFTVGRARTDRTVVRGLDMYVIHFLLL